MYRQQDINEVTIDDRSTDPVTGAVVVDKRLNSRTKYSNKSSKTPASIVSEIIEKNAIKRGEDGKGVWNPLGKAYTCNGDPDTDLVEMGNDGKKSKGRRKHISTRDYAEPTQKMIKLMKHVKATQQLLKEWKLFDRPEPEEKSIKPVKKDDRPQSSAPRKKSTLEVIAELGQEKKVKKKAIRLKKADYDFALEKDPKTLVARWHKQFHSTRQKLDDELLQNLVLREKDKHEVLRSKILRNNAVYIVGLPGERKYAPSRSRKSTRYSSQEDRSNSMGSASDSRSFIGVGDTCYYESPTGIEELVTVISVNGTKGSTDEHEYTVQTLNSNNAPFTAYGRYLIKHYLPIEQRRSPRRKAFDISLWEKAKLMKIKSMAMDVPTVHFVNRIREVHLRESTVNNHDDDKGRSSPLKNVNDSSPSKAAAAAK